MVPCLLLCLFSSLGQTSAAAPVKVFFDTDMETDCDDAGALAVLHALADRGECEILATVVSVRDVHSAATVDAVNTYYSRPHLPLGMVKGAGVLEKSNFAARIATDFPNRVKSSDDAPDATLTYRDVLEKQPTVPSPSSRSAISPISRPCSNSLPTTATPAASNSSKRKSPDGFAWAAISSVPRRRTT